MSITQDTDRAAVLETIRQRMNPGRIVHWTRPPYTHALCGAKVTTRKPQGGVTCAVCNDLRARRRGGNR
jgi:hypothetical protein